MGVDEVPLKEGGRVRVEERPELRDALASGAAAFEPAGSEESRTGFPFMEA